MITPSKVVTNLKELSAQIMATSSPAPASTANEGPSWINQVAVLTGVLAALTGFLTVRTTMLTNQAIYESNQAILAQTDASDAWSEFQANSIKARIIEVQLAAAVATMSPADKAKLNADDAEMRSKQPGLKQNAEARTNDRKTHLESGMKFLGQKDLLGYAGMLAQLGIALASVAALIRRRAVFNIGIAAGLGAVALTGYVLVAVYLAQ